MMMRIPIPKNGKVNMPITISDNEPPKCFVPRLFFTVDALHLGQKFVGVVI